MKRRQFIARLGATGAYAVLPRLARAQQDTRVRRLAILLTGIENQPRKRSALRCDLRCWSAPAR